MPGLADMHVHHTGSGAFITGSEPPMHDDQDLLLYLVNGVTTVRNMSGMAADIAIKRKLAGGEILGPHYYSSGPPLISVDRGLFIDTPQKARDVVAAQKKAGYDFIFLDEKTLTDYLARPEIAYIPKSSYDEEMNDIRKHESFLNDEKAAAGTKQMFELGMQYAYFLHRQGIPFILGSDTGGIFPLVPGFSIHGELELLNQAGLSPVDALRTGTINVARFLGNSDTRGSIAENKDSDLVLLDENPLDSVSNTRKIRGVMIGKTWIDKAGIGRILLRLKKR